MSNLLLAGLGGVLGPSHLGLRQLAEHGLAAFDIVYELFGSLVMLFVGGIFFFGSKHKVDSKARLLGAAAIFLGLVLITDALWKMKR